jgi:ABC-type uncharacterized transport system permease subunit
MRLVDTVLRFFAASTPAAWTAAAAAYLCVFVRDDAGARRWAPRLAWAAVAVHLGLLAAVAQAIHACPLLVPGSMLSGLGLAVGVVHLLLERRARDNTIGVFPITAALVFALAGAAADPTLGPDSAAPRATMAVHVAGAILGYAGLLLGALFGALYLVQRNALKKHRFGLFWERLPSLELLDQFSSRSLLAGVAFLTLTIAFGHAARAAEHGSYYETAILATDAVWLGGLVIVVARKLDKVRPATFAVASLGLFGLAMALLVYVEHGSRIHRGV